MFGRVKFWQTKPKASKPKYQPQTPPIMNIREFLDELCSYHQRTQKKPLEMTYLGEPIDRDRLPYLSDEQLQSIVIHGMALKKGIRP